ncbi:MAG: glycosyltransferase [Erysipelotrichia bacterium]|nr:glycosyltransferase [Erysipelotrichia bacterium]
MLKISIVLTTFNGTTRGYLGLAIDSVLNQSFKEFELLIIDDGSSDNTKEFCKKYLADNRVKYIYQDNKGLAGARNTGIENSQGEYICFLDDDDVWKEDKLQKQVDFFEQNQDIGMVFTNLELIDEVGKAIGYQTHKANGDIYKELFFENIVDAPSSCMIKKEVFEKVGNFKEWMKSAEEYELWFRLAKEFKIYSINEPLVEYRIHQNKLSTNYSKMEFYGIATLYYALENNNSIDEIEAYYKLYEKYASKHFSLKNMKEFRKYFWIAFAYKTPTLKMCVKYIFSLAPFVLKLRGSK